MFGNNFGIPYFCWKTASPIIQLSCRKRQRFLYCFWDIYESLKDPYLKSPSSVNDWKSISERFEEVWNFPHVVGTIDGKHIRIECHKLSGTLYHNYKGFFRMVLLAVCDAGYCFTLFYNDCNVLANSFLRKGLESNKIQLPPDEPLDGCAFSPLPYYLLGDDIFPLKKWSIKPCLGKHLTEEQKIYNYRLSCCRRVIRNAFDILSARWRIFHRPIRGTVKHVERYVLAVLALHNYLWQTSSASCTPNGFVDSENATVAFIWGNGATEITGNVWKT